MTLPKRPLSLTVNGKPVGPIDVPDDMMLLDVLHEYLGLTGSRMACGQGICQFDDYKSGQLLQQMRTGRQITVQLMLQGTEAGPFTQTLNGFDLQLQRALAAQRGP